MNSRFRRAVGLSYDSPYSESARSRAPRLEIKGDGFAADEIVKIARAVGVPVLERPALARMLSHAKLDQEIPRDLFEVVATIFAELFWKSSNPDLKLYGRP